MSLTFQIMTFEKYLTKSFEFLLWGTPILTNPALPMTPLFYCRILFYSKNVDVCKKLELKPLRFDRDIRV